MYNLIQLVNKQLEPPRWATTSVKFCNHSLLTSHEAALNWTNSRPRLWRNELISNYRLVRVSRADREVSYGNLWFLKSVLPAPFIAPPAAHSRSHWQNPWKNIIVQSSPRALFGGNRAPPLGIALSLSYITFPAVYLPRLYPVALDYTDTYFYFSYVMRM